MIDCMKRQLTEQVDHNLAMTKVRQKRWLIQRCRQQFRSRILEKLTVVLLTCCLSWLPGIAASFKPVRRVLVLYEASLSYPAVANVDRAIRDTLGKAPYQIEFYSETLDAVMLPDERSQLEVGQEYVRKYRDHKPDLIIAEGATSLTFIVHAHDKFFSGIPIVFCAVDEHFDGTMPGSYLTGTWMTFDAAKTLEAALQLAPSTKHVVVVGGVGKYDRMVEASVKESFRNYASRLDFTYLVDLDMSSLVERLSRLPSNTIIVFTDFSKDSTGTLFVGATQSLPMIIKAANAPVFVLSDTLVGGGAVGGSVVSWASQGRVAAETAIKIFKGERPQDIPVLRVGTKYMFDWQALQRWQLKESALPPDSLVLNRQPTLWESHKWFIISGISLMILQALLISGLLWQRARRRKAENEVRESEQRFRLVANTAPVMIWMSGTDKLCSYVNQPWLDFTGRGLAAELENGWLESVHPEDLTACLDTYKQAFDRREPFTMQYRVRRHDGDYRWVLNRGMPRFNDDHSFAGYTGSCVDITDRKLAEETLSTVSRRLIDAQEQERTRIARELHDDINQRIAMVGMEADELQQNLPDSAVELRNRTYELQSHLSEVGSEIQAISHRLHSSKLEYLGLVAACKSFCNEIAEHNGVTVQFSNEAIPHAVPQDVSLCIFRVLQESLTNGIKHSGAERFEVDLRAISGEIQLTVRDDGIGFDAAAGMVSRGLGLISMRERVSLVKGVLLIASQPGGGAEIIARVPVMAKAGTRTVPELGVA
jgi:PAS domain S-box-containing protein